MGRQKMVTRTIKLNIFNCLCMNTVLCEPFNKEISTGRSFKSEKKRDEFLREQIDTETEKFVSVVDATVNDVLYGMPEDEFIKNAVELPARPVKDAEFADCMNQPEASDSEN